MKKRWNKNPERTSLFIYIFLTCLALMIVWHLLSSWGNLGESILTGVGYLLGILTPFFIGLLLAYFLAPFVDFIEKLINKLFRKPGRRMRRRACAMGVVYLAVGAVVVLIIGVLIPNIYENVEQLINHIPGYLESVNGWISDLVNNYELLAIPEIQTHVQQALPEVLLWLGEQLRMLPQILVQMLSGTISSVVNWVIGAIASVYILLYRHQMSAALKEFVRNVFRRSRAHSLISFLEQTDHIFARFIGRKLIECLLVGVVSFIGLWILQIPYYILLGFIVGIFTLIPYFGGIISAVLALLITLLDSPDKVLYVAIFLVAVQAVDSWLVSPKLFGGSMGMNPFWVIFAVTIGGGLFGMLGMFLAVPIMAVIQLLMKRVMTHLRIRNARRSAPVYETADQPPAETNPAIPPSRDIPGDQGDPHGPKS